MMPAFGISVWSEETAVTISGSGPDSASETEKEYGEHTALRSTAWLGSPISCDAVDGGAHGSGLGGVQRAVGMVVDEDLQILLTRGVADAVENGDLAAVGDAEGRGRGAGRAAIEETDPGAHAAGAVRLRIEAAQGKPIAHRGGGDVCVLTTRLHAEQEKDDGHSVVVFSAIRAARGGIEVADELTPN
jgi:hypothetical protein